MKQVLLLCLLTLGSFVQAKTITVGTTGDYVNLKLAAAVANPGDTLLLTGENHVTDMTFSLQGAKNNPVYIIGKGDNCYFRGGAKAFQITNARYLVIKNIHFDNQSGSDNVLNLDDGGDYSTPATDITIENCSWDNMHGDGEELKMAGVNNFVIRNCSFDNLYDSKNNGRAEIDMVGCHDGIIEDCTFSNSNMYDSKGIQAKGGSSGIIIRRNLFKNAGARPINIGGSSGSQYFRPSGVNYEASDITVYANVFVGGETAFAFVSSVNCKVVNNTIIKPTKWAFRILQENTSVQACGNNTVINNLFLLTTDIQYYAVNVGSNTSQSSFTYSNNLWYIDGNDWWGGPSTIDWNKTTSIINKNPLLDTSNYSVASASPAIGNGLLLSYVETDCNGKEYNNPPTIGAVESNTTSGTEAIGLNPTIEIYPNPASDRIFFNTGQISLLKFDIQIFDVAGKSMMKKIVNSCQGNIEINVSSLKAGTYVLVASSSSFHASSIFVVK